MPTIPQYLARQGLPSSGGAGPRGGVVGVPVVGQPGAQDGGLNALERSLGAIPEALQNTGGLIVRTEELQAHRQKAFDLLKAKGEHQELRLELQPAYEQWRQGDWQTLPERVEEEGRRLIENRAVTLTPQARALFEEDAKQTLAVFQQRAIEERIKRTEGETAFTMARELQQGQEALARATNPLERAVAQGQLEETARRFVGTGLVDGVKMATALKQTFDAVHDERVHQANQVDPDGMALQLLAQSKGETTRADLPKARPETLSDMLKEARAVQQQRLGQAEHAERMADYRFAKRQEQTAADVSARLSIVLPTPENVGQYDQLLAEVNQKAQGENPALSFSQQQHFAGQIRSLRTAALAPREADDPATERKLVIALDVADNNADLESVRGLLIASAAKLKPETFQRLSNGIRDRKQAGHYSQLHGFREGVRIILGGDISEASMDAFLRGMQNEEQQRNTRQAMDAFRARMADLAAVSRDQADVEGPGIALEMRKAFIEDPKQERQFDSLPRPLQGRNEKGEPVLLNRDEAIAAINKLPATSKAQQQRYLDQWDEWRKTYTPPKSSSSPSTPGSTGQPYTKSKKEPL